MRACCLLFLILFVQGPLTAQTTMRQVIISNGGTFGPGNFVKVASFTPSTGTYIIFDSIPASSTQDVVCSDGEGFVAADSFLVKYDLDSYQRLATAMVPGIRKIAVNDSIVVVTRGFGASGDYVQVYRRSNLQLLYSVSQVSDESEGVVIKGDTAYVAVPGNFMSTVGKLALIDLNSQTFIREVDLDTLGAGIKRLFIKDNVVWSVNTISFGSTYGALTRYDIASGLFQNLKLDFPVGDGAGVKGNLLYASFHGGMGSFSLPMASVVDTTIFTGSFAGSVLDTINDRFFVTKTDFFSFGRLYWYSLSGTFQDSLEIGISPEALAVDYRISTSTSPAQASDFRVWPNPAQDFVAVNWQGQGAKTLAVRDLQGRLLVSKKGFSGQHTTKLDLSGLPAGLYVLELTTQSGKTAKRLLIQ